MHHVDCDITSLTRTPRIADAPRLFYNDAAIFTNALAMECRLRRQPLGAMRGTFTRDDALAQQHLGPLHGALFDEVIVLDYEHLPDVFGMVQRHVVMRVDLVVSDITIVLSQVLKKNNRICRTKF